MSRRASPAGDYVYDCAWSPIHPALFAAVMRKAGVAKQLECHGFVCDSPEEAIMMAANLYQALLETMKRNKRAGSASQVRNTFPYGIV